MNSAKLKFLIDVSAGRGIDKYLRGEGYDSKAVSDIDPRMEDEDIIRIAASEGRGASVKFCNLCNLCPQAGSARFPCGSITESRETLCTPSVI